MRKLNLNQRKVIAELSVNLAVAWISIGVISQLLSREKNIFIALGSTIMFFILLFISDSMKMFLTLTLS